ncbi:MAG TPA: TlpA disulfide reductase family protein [Steroidobacteraceae bacterium]|jgi:thiol-disulfide isomerase/thioredoxin
MSKRAGPLLLAALLLGAGFATLPAALAAGPKVGDLPPPKLAWNLNLSDFRGKIVIISFWASWCPPCRKELPVLAAIQKQATRDRVVVFAVDWQDDPGIFQQLRRVLQKVDLTLLDDSGDHLGREYDVNSLPHMIIIGRDGRIAAIHVGYNESEIPTLAKEINLLWAQPGAASPQESSH